ncbi:MAG: hypothetical protein ACLUD0_12570 [Eubacterium ramulus]
MRTLELHSEIEYDRINQVLARSFHKLACCSRSELEKMGPGSPDLNSGVRADRILTGVQVLLLEWTRAWWEVSSLGTS